MIRSLLRRFLGLDDVIDALNRQTAITDQLHDELLGLRSDLTVTFRDELDPQRKAMSDRLGEKAIKRLEAEDWARKHTTGEA